MTEVDNACPESGVQKMEVEYSIKTVDRLRGRLLAERLATRNAKEETEQLENKLMELENMLKQEAKSRNRAEKRLKLLFKKLESMNISYVSDGSEYSILEDKIDISSPSSTNSLGAQESNQNCNPEQGSENNLHQNNNNLEKISGKMGQIESPRSPDLSDHFQEKNIAQNFTVENFSETSDNLGFDQNCDDLKMNEQRFRFWTEDRFNKEKKEDDDDNMNRVDNSMALVTVDSPQQNRTIDPKVLDSAVKEVLDALKRAKEQLQSSIEKSRVNMIRVG